MRTSTTILGPTLLLVGGLLMLEQLGLNWARTLIAATWPVFILIAGAAAVDLLMHGGILGRSVVAATVGLILLDGATPTVGAVLAALGPPALVIGGAVLLIHRVSARLRADDGSPGPRVWQAGAMSSDDGAPAVPYQIAVACQLVGAPASPCPRVIERGVRHAEVVNAWLPHR